MGRKYVKVSDKVKELCYGENEISDNAKNVLFILSICINRFNVAEVDNKYVDSKYITDSIRDGDINEVELGLKELYEKGIIYHITKESKKGTELLYMLNEQYYTLEEE